MTPHPAPPLAAIELDLGESRIDPTALFELPESSASRFYWSAPGDQGFALAALGIVERQDSWGSLQLGACGRACARSRQRMVGEVPPLWLGGFAFDGYTRDAVAETPGSERSPGALRSAWQDFPSTSFRLPEWVLIAGSGGLRLRHFGRKGLDRLRGEAEAVAERLLTSESARIAEAPPSAPRPDRVGGIVAAGGAGSSVAKAVEAVTEAKAARLGRATDPSLDLDSIRAAVARTVEAIRRGEAEKVVLAVSRSRNYDDIAQPDPLEVLSRFRREQPGCFHFMIAPKPGSAWVGASPERLVRLREGRLSTMALAGSAARGATPEEDRALGQALLASAKDRREHALVVEDIVDRLRDIASEIRVPREPSLRRLATIQHLETLVEAAVPADQDILDLAARLHPTPALGGSPREAALRLIREIEPDAPGRGWYAGGVGWIDGRGEGEIAVAIRSLLLRPGRAIAFAGAGLVAESDPDAEAREIALKLEVARAALG